MKKKIILDLCGGTGGWSRPFQLAGYEVINITFPDYDVNKTTESEGGSLIFNEPDGSPGVAGDFREITDPEPYLIVDPKDVVGILAAPPCTMFSLARTTAKTKRDLAGAMEIVRSCMRIIWYCKVHGNLKFWALENPKGLLRQFMGKPGYTFDPSEFGADYNKATDIWGYFNEPKKTHPFKRAASTDTNSRKLPKIPTEYKRDPNMRTQQIARSITNPAFALAFFKANNLPAPKKQE